MRRRRRNTSALAVTLFPFLAVLICTMGVLVILLVVAVRAADVKAQKEAGESRESLESELREFELELEADQLRLDGIKEFRPEMVGILQAEREKRSHLIQSLRDIDKQAEDLAAQLVQLNEESFSQQLDREAVERELAELEEQLQSKQAQFDELKSERPVENVVYSIVPTDAAMVTKRRPIYLECTEFKVTLQPFGIDLELSDFQEPIDIGNPLDVALLTIRSYWDENDVTGDEGAAYPLIVVRPGGARTYALARHAMKSWEDEFGYELIEAEVPLDFGVVDKNLEDEVRLAVANAKFRNRQRLARVTNAWGAGNSSSGGSGVNHQVGSRGAARYTGLTADSAQGGFSMSPAQESALRRAESKKQTTARKATDPHSQPGETNQADQGAAGGSSIGNSMESIAQTKGANWALPGHDPNGTVYRRPIRVICEVAHLTVISGASLQSNQVHLNMNGPTQDVVDGLVNAVWETMESWGYAGTDGYWKPDLRMEVRPGGEQRARELMILFNDSGLEINATQTRGRNAP